jgi:hypothetical protein
MPSRERARKEFALPTTNTTTPMPIAVSGRTKATFPCKKDFKKRRRSIQSVGLIAGSSEGQREENHPSGGRNDCAEATLDGRLAVDAAVVARKLMASRLQQSREVATRTPSPLSPAILKPRFLPSAMSPSCRRSTLPAWRSSKGPWTFITRYPLQCSDRSPAASTRTRTTWNRR